MKKFKVLLMFLILVLASCGTNTPMDNKKLENASQVEFNEKDYMKIVSPNNELGFDLLAKAPIDSEGNKLISPISLFMAMAMVYNGAESHTKKELAKVLHIEELYDEDLNKANVSLMNLLNRDAENMQLTIANSIWLNEQYQFRERFTTNSKDYFNAEINQFNVHDSNSPKMINNWINQKTDGKIPQIIGGELSPDILTILINAIYFKGYWTYPFDSSLTEERPFNLQDSAVKKVPMMRLHEELKYLENELFQAISLPYSDEGMSMKIFLPKENISIDEFEEELNLSNWQKWLREFYDTEGTILLPKFKMEQAIEFKGTLEALGVVSAFNDHADFSGIIQEDSGIAISSVKQKTFIEVDEEGTEAAATTSVEIHTTSMQPMNKPFYMEVNRPFFISIVDETSGAILFMGTIINPKE
nr:serpin family protein [Lysinibacillus timonensis]